MPDKKLALRHFYDIFLEVLPQRMCEVKNE
jgi:hypothetical protein